MNTIECMALRNADRAIDLALSNLEIIAEDINNLPVDHLADIGARIKRLSDMADFCRKNMNARIIDHATCGELRGAHHCAKVISTTRKTLDMKAARARLGEAWCEDHTKLSQSQSVRFSV